MWKQKEYNFGEVTKGSTNLALFEYNGPKKISAVVPSCSCSVASIKGNNVAVRYKAPEFPRYLKGSGILQTVDTKTITVKFSDGTEDKLTIKAILKA